MDHRPIVEDKVRSVVDCRCQGQNSPLVNSIDPKPRIPCPIIVIPNTAAMTCGRGPLSCGQGLTEGQTVIATLLYQPQQLRQSCYSACGCACKASAVV